MKRLEKREKEAGTKGTIARAEIGNKGTDSIRGEERYVLCGSARKPNVSLARSESTSTKARL